MRRGPVILLLLPLLAGCVGPGPDDDPAPTCPAWIMGKSTADVTDVFAPGPNFTRTDIEDDLGGGLLSFEGYPLDRIELDFQQGPDQTPETARGIAVQDAILTMTVADEAGAAIHAYDQGDGRSSARPTWVFGEGIHTNFTLLVDLAPADEAPDPRPVTVHWHLERDLDGDPETRDAAEIHYKGLYWYRRCGV